MITEKLRRYKQKEIDARCKRFVAEKNSKEKFVEEKSFGHASQKKNMDDGRKKIKKE